MLAAAYVAQQVTVASWERMVDYQTPYVFDLQTEATSPAVTDHVVLVIIDGLRLDVSRELSTINRIRRQGADLVVTTGQPSLSNPAVAVFGSGTWQEVNGVTTNWHDGAVTVDNIFACLNRAGLSSVVVAGKGWGDAFGQDIGTLYAYPWSEGYDVQVTETALHVLQQPPSLLIVHYSGVDEAGHESGGASRHYFEVARDIDDLVGRLAAAIDLERTTLMITSDHGHIDTGGHGGWETEVIRVPLILAGEGVSSGVASIQGNQTDIAPTIAALLGVPVPAHSGGKILFEALDLTPEQQAVSAVNLARARQAFVRAYLDRLTVSQGQRELGRAASLLAEAERHLNQDEPRKAFQAATAAVNSLDGTAASGRQAWLTRGTRARVPLAAASVLLALGLVLAAGLLSRQLWSALAWAAVYLALYALLFFGRGLSFSLSAFNDEALIKAFFNARMLDAAVLLVLVCLAYALWTGRRAAAHVGTALGPPPPATTLDAAAGVAVICLAAGLGIAAQVFWGYALVGLDFNGYIPNLHAGFKFYLDMLQLTAVGLATPVAVIVGAITWHLAAGPARSRRGRAQ